MPDRSIRGLYFEPGERPAVVVLDPWGPEAVRKAIGSDIIHQRSIEVPSLTCKVAVFHPAFYPNGHLQADDSPLDEHLPALVVAHQEWRVVSLTDVTLSALAAILVAQEFSTPNRKAIT